MRENGRSSPSEEPAQKKQRVLACRHRKQKCEDNRPCSNCQKAQEECLPTDPAPRPQIEQEYVKALEERIAELESHDPKHSLDHMNADAAVDDKSNTTRPATDAQGKRPDEQVVRRYSHTDRSIDRRRTDVTETSFNRFRRQSDLTSSSAVDGVNHGVSPAQYSGGTKRTYSQVSPAMALSLEDSEEEVDHLIHGLMAEPSPHALVTESSPSVHMHSPMDRHRMAPAYSGSVSRETEEMLFNAYRDRAQAQYPFFHWPSFLAWSEEWKQMSATDPEIRSWQGFFVNMVYATALVLLASPRIDHMEARQFYRTAVSMLPHALSHANPVLHLQAYLILGVHALHRSSTQRILSLASTSMRYCAQNQFHLSETEPTGPGNVLEIQVRRRCFWSAYNLDRIVMASLHIPPSIPDSVITTKLYANIDDDDLSALAVQVPTGLEIQDSPAYTCVSSSLHIVQCRRIQSEIAGYTLRWDYATQFEDSLDWRIRILSELESYKARVQSVSDPQAKGHTSQRWLGVFYYYSLLMLYRPTKEGVLGPAGDWSVQASSQACLIFRKSQMDRQIAQAWLGLLVQFQSGITLLYCFWATPPEYRTDNYDSPDVSDALRACSNILAIMTDRWPKADCLRDVFELFAREVPLVDRPSRPPTRLSQTSAAIIREKLPTVRALVVHRSILRMIEEMITDDFPRLHGVNPPPPPPQRHPPPTGSVIQSTLRERPLTTASPANMTFEMPFATANNLYPMDREGVDVPLSTDELLAFPGMFDLEGWT